MGQIVSYHRSMSLGRILIVDDDEELLALLGAQLREKGYEVVAAVNGARALEAFGRKTLDVVLLDYRLPDIDGMSLLRILRTREPGVRVVMMSGVLSLDLAEVVIDAGACDLVGKPVDFGRLERAIRKTLLPAMAA